MDNQLSDKDRKIQVDIVTKSMLKLLTLYRAVPIMFEILYGRGVERIMAVEDFKRIMKELSGVYLEDYDIRCLLGRFDSWIFFIKDDFNFYGSGEDPGLYTNTYWGRMAEEAALVTNILPFSLKVDEPVILDIGAGRIPYAKYFVASNQDKPITYIAIDKREEIMNINCPEGIKTFLRIFTKDLSMTLANLEAKPNLLFLANFLHCVNPKVFLNEILPLLPNTKEIKILEVRPNSILDFGFNYHMYRHCQGQRVDISVLSSIDGLKIMSVENISDYQVMYTLCRI